MTNHNWVRILGFILTLLTGIGVGVWGSWNGRFISEFIAQTGGILPLLAAIGAIIGAALVVFWPVRWNQRVRSVLTLIVLLVALLFGGEPIRAAFAQAPWLVLGILIGAIIWLWILFGLTVLARLPIPGWLRRFAARLNQPAAP